MHALRPPLNSGRLRMSWSMATALRWFVFVLSLATGGIAAWLVAEMAPLSGAGILDFIRLALTFLCIFWLAWGALVSVLGIFHLSRRTASVPAAASRSRLAVLVPIYNEDPQATFARVAAMSTGLSNLGAHDRTDFFILSDSTSVDVAASEVIWLERLLGEVPEPNHIFYRRRGDNVGRKAGNIEDFIRRSGAAYDYALVLDADSLMEPHLILEMVSRMDADPDLGLLQSVPTIIKARSFFGRALQFAGAFYAPAYTRGTALLQSDEGPYWGHNAILRVHAFAASCGLPVLSGEPPFGGHVLSHDYVEAALLARNGWKVRLAPDLVGSYEEGPENILDFAKRDKRWCQGNLQHSRLVFAPGLRMWNRVTLAHGILAYLQAPIWIALVILSFASPAIRESSVDREATNASVTLLVLIAILLLVPKMLIALHAQLTGHARLFGGPFHVAAAFAAELVFSSLLTPIILLMQSRAVAQVISGADGGWPASNRDDGRVSLQQAWSGTWWITAVGLLSLAVVIAVAPDLAGWSLLTLSPMIAAPLIIAASSYPLRKIGWVWRSPQDVRTPPILREWTRIHSNWSTLSEGPRTRMAPSAIETADASR